MFRLLNKLINKFLINYNHKDFILKIGSVFCGFWRSSLNSNYDPDQNGEYRVLQAISNISKSTMVIDVGANVGNYTKKSYELGSSVIAFEPLEVNFKKLLLKTKDINHSKNIELHMLGLSNKNKELYMNFASDNSEKSLIGNYYKTLYKNKKITFLKKKVKLITGDSFLKKNKNFLKNDIFLKIDVEGHGLEVLRGFKESIKKKYINMIQFEYNKHNIFTNTPLYKYYEFLEDFDIGRIYSKTVRFKKYSIEDENFVDGNFLAIRKNLYNELKGNLIKGYEI